MAQVTGMVIGNSYPSDPYLEHEAFAKNGFKIIQIKSPFKFNPLKGLFFSREGRIVELLDQRLVNV